MITTRHPELFYHHSPFLPIITDEDINELTHKLSKNKVTLSSAIAQQASYIGHALNVLHENQLYWILDNFQCNSQDILLYYLGFTTPITLILAAIQMDFVSTKTVIKNLSIPTQIKQMQGHNRYKIKLLHDFYYIVANKPNEKLNIILETILSLLRQKPFTDNKYYHVGIEASIYTMMVLFDLYQKRSTSK